MKKIEQKVLNFIAEKKLIEKGDKILLALSGGPDSVFLTHLLVKFNRKLKIKVGAIHINHMIRGKEAGLDEEFCRKLSLYLGIEFRSVRKNVKAFSEKNKISVEEGGRKIRYTEFESMRKKFGYDKIATAHNCSDNAETILLNLIKGTGLKGISGIPYKRDTIIRPILSLTKDEILNYLKENKIDYRIDITNQRNDYERNFLRNEIIPLLKQKLNPDLENNLFNSSELFKESAAYIGKSAAELIEKMKQYPASRLSVSVEILKNTDTAVTGLFLKTVIEKKYPVETNYNDIKKIISLLSSETGKKAELSNGIKAVRERKEIVISAGEIKSSYSPVIFRTGDNVKLKDKILTVKEYGELSFQFTRSREKEYISGDNISGDFLLRRWNTGERFFPFGLKGSKKVSDFLNEQKLPSSEKKDQLVLTNNGKIIWIVGLRLDDRFKITKQTKKVLELWLK